MINSYNFPQSEILIEGKSLSCHRSARLVFTDLDFSLQSGMAMVGVDAPLQNIVVGTVLVAAVLIDIIYRRRIGGK